MEAVHSSATPKAVKQIAAAVLVLCCLETKKTVKVNKICFCHIADIHSNT